MSRSSVVRSSSLAVALGALGLLGVACGGKAAPAPASPGPSGGPAAAGPPYAALFEDGKTLRYRRVSESSMHDPDDPAADEAGNVVSRSAAEVTCKVAARQLGAWQAARLACDGADDGDELRGELTAVYLADARGVWRAVGAELPADEAAAAALAQGAPLLAAAPVAAEEKKEEEEGFGESRSVAQAPDGAWCHAWGSWGGDEAGGSVCFAAGRGLTKVSSFWAGGSVRDDWFELLP